MTTQQSFSFTEDASLRIERLLMEVCPVHIGTTLDGGECPICDLDERMFREPDGIYNPSLRAEAEPR